MNKYFSRNSSIHTISRGLLVQGDKIILCKVKGKNWYFLPGGHIEDGESLKDSLVRELNEEIGQGDYKIDSFLGICENIFSLDENNLQHEINVVFKVIVPDTLTISTKEDHLDFILIEKNDIKNHEILPKTLKDGLLEWLENGNIFFKEL
jgi:ADP-ribose pyrophosphatase YjhB (NUDIX family)